MICINGDKMGILCIILGIVTLFLLKQKKIKDYSFVAFSLLLLSFLIAYLRFDYSWLILLFLFAVVIIYFIKEKRAMLLAFMYVITIILLLLGLITEKNNIYKDASTYINKDIINQVIPINLQEKYLQYIALADYSSADVESYIIDIQNNLQNELDELSIFEAYETYRYTKIYLEERKNFYHSNETQIINKIDEEIKYFETLNHAAKKEYKKEIQKIVEEVIV